MTIICKRGSLFPLLPLQPAKADHFLIADRGLESLVAKTRDIRTLTRSCASFLSPALAQQLLAAQMKDGELALLAANPAAAAKLKLVAESLRKFLLQQGSKVNSVSVRVQPTRSQTPSQAAEKRALLSESGKAELSALYARLEADSPAREALGRLLGRQSPKNRSQAAPRKSAKGPAKRGTGQP